MNASQRKAEHLPHDVESWYPVLREHTFETHQFSLSIEQVNAIRHFYRQRYLQHRELTADDCRNLRELAHRIDVLIARFGGVFSFHFALVCNVRQAVRLCG